MNSRNLIAAATVLLAAGALPWVASEFLQSLALACHMYIALATSWSMFCGATRYLSLATSAFFGVGAYTSAPLATTSGQGNTPSSTALV